jgi:hypothetical protein
MKITVEKYLRWNFSFYRNSSQDAEEKKAGEEKKAAEEKKEKAKPKRVVNENLMLAFRYFDKSGTVPFHATIFFGHPSLIIACV